MNGYKETAKIDEKLTAPDGQQVKRQKSKVKSNLCSPKSVSSLPQKVRKEIKNIERENAKRESLINQCANPLPKREMVELLTFAF